MVYMTAGGEVAADGKEMRYTPVARIYSCRGIRPPLFRPVGGTGLRVSA